MVVCTEYVVSVLCPVHKNTVKRFEALKLIWTRFAHPKLSKGRSVCRMNAPTKKSTRTIFYLD